MANEPRGAAASSSLASRVVLDARGRWKIAVARPANAIGLSMASGGLESEPHAHRESQLMYLVRGELICEASSALWIVPPQSALWIPASLTHRIRARAARGLLRLRRARRGAEPPPGLLRGVGDAVFRELLLRLATRPALYDLDGPDARLVSVLLDELATVSIEKHRLPMPIESAAPSSGGCDDRRSGEPRDDEDVGQRIGVGERTLNRVLVEETGLSFGRWRQQLHIILAIQKLSRGATVQSVALDLGYESASSFVTMFRKALGMSPARYMASRLAAPA